MSNEKLSKELKDLKSLKVEPEGYVKDIDWIRQGLGGGSPDDLISANVQFKNGGRVDLFEDYDNQPTEVSEILSEYDLEDNDYKVLKELQARLENEAGYTFDYGLDATPYGLRPVGVKLSELEGYDDEYAKGGEIKKYEVPYERLVDGEYENEIKTFENREDAEKFAKEHYSYVDEVSYAEGGEIFNDYFDIDKVKSIENVEVFTNQRKGHKNYVRVDYVPLSRPQTMQVEFRKIPFNTDKELNYIKKTLQDNFAFTYAEGGEVKYPTPIEEISDNVLIGIGKNAYLTTGVVNNNMYEVVDVLRKNPISFKKGTKVMVFGSVFQLDNKKGNKRFKTKDEASSTYAEGGEVNKEELNKYLSSHKEMFDDNAKTITKKDVVDFIIISKNSDKKYWVKDMNTGYSYYIYKGDLRLNDGTGGIFSSTKIGLDRLKDEHKFKIKEEELYDWEKELEKEMLKRADPNYKKPVWEKIVDKFNDVFYLDGSLIRNYKENELSSSEVKARGSNNGYYSYEFRDYSPLLTWKEAVDRFKESLTKDELNSIEISYKKEEYADLEEHDTEKYHKQIFVKLKKYEKAVRRIND